MDFFDYFIVGLGAVLIIIGLYLFAAGKQRDATSNNVEGFGIKLNVSNPSIILIVMGIGLVLVPKLLPNDRANPPPPTSKPIAIEPVNQLREQPQVIGSPADATTATNTKAAVTPSTPAAFLPTGNWFLNNYEENGVDLSANVSGNITFNIVNESQASWYGNLTAMDVWGNGASYFYQGKIIASGGGHQISIENSNDPSFTFQAGLPLTLKMDPSGLLHMEYPYQGSLIILHWRQ